MYEYKLSMCPNSAPHDWTYCRYAHDGEVARRFPACRGVVEVQCCFGILRSGSVMIQPMRLCYSSSNTCPLP